MGGSAAATFANRFNKLGVDMVVGDFNGDRIDDIAVLSYFFVNGGRGGHTNKNAYRPQVKIKYGKAGGGSTGGGSSLWTATPMINSMFVRWEKHGLPAWLMITA